MRHRTVMTSRARAMRKAMTEPEVILWSRLRGRGPEGLRFRRQHPIGSVILDFYCPSARLAIEVDGSSHFDDEAIARDMARDRWLRSQGIEVQRIPASSVCRELDDVVDGILRFADMRRAAIQRMRPAPSTTGSSAGGPPPAIAPRWGR
jgi:very-short-patch-repair endonuclease